MEIMEEDPLSSMPPLPHSRDWGGCGRLLGFGEAGALPSRLSHAELAHQDSVASLLRQDHASEGAPDGLFDDALFRDPVLEEALYELTGSSPLAPQARDAAHERPQHELLSPGGALASHRSSDDQWMEHLVHRVMVNREGEAGSVSTRHVGMHARTSSLTPESRPHAGSYYDAMQMQNCRSHGALPSLTAGHDGQSRGRMLDCSRSREVYDAGLHNSLPRHSTHSGLPEQMRATQQELHAAQMTRYRSEQTFDRPPHAGQCGGGPVDAHSAYAARNGNSRDQRRPTSSQAMPAPARLPESRRKLLAITDTDDEAVGVAQAPLKQQPSQGRVLGLLPALPQPSAPPAPAVPSTRPQKGITGSVLAEARSSRKSGHSMTLEGRIAIERAARPQTGQFKGVQRKPWSVWFDAKAKMPDSQEEVDLGSFPTGRMAADAHDLAVRTLDGPLTDLNFEDAEYPCIEDLQALPPAEFVLRMQRYAEMSSVRTSRYYGVETGPDDSFEARYPAAGGEFIPAEPKTLAAAKPKRRRSGVKPVQEQTSADASTNGPHGLATIDETMAEPTVAAPEATEGTSGRPKRQRGSKLDKQAE